MPQAGAVPPEVCLHTRHVKELRIVGTTHRLPGCKPYTEINIGGHFTWYPSLEQLARLRDAIALLEAEASAALSPPGSPSEQNPPNTEEPL